MILNQFKLENTIKLLIPILAQCIIIQIQLTYVWVPSMMMVPLCYHLSYLNQKKEHPTTMKKND